MQCRLRPRGAWKAQAQSNQTWVSYGAQKCPLTICCCLYRGKTSQSCTFPSLLCASKQRNSNFFSYAFPIPTVASAPLSSSTCVHLKRLLALKNFFRMETKQNPPIPSGFILFWFFCLTVMLFFLSSATSTYLFHCITSVGRCFLSK